MKLGAKEEDADSRFFLRTENDWEEFFGGVSN